MVSIYLQGINYVIPVQVVYLAKKKAYKFRGLLLELE